MLRGYGNAGPIEVAAMMCALSPFFSRTQQWSMETNPLPGDSRLHCFPSHAYVCCSRCRILAKNPGWRGGASGRADAHTPMGFPACMLGGQSGLDCPYWGIVGWEMGQGKVIGSASTDNYKLADRVAAVSGRPETMPHTSAAVLGFTRGTEDILRGQS